MDQEPHRFSTCALTAAPTNTHPFTSFGLGLWIWLWDEQWDWKETEKWAIYEEMDNASKCSKDARSQAYFYYCVIEGSYQHGSYCAFRLEWSCWHEHTSFSVQQCVDA